MRYQLIETFLLHSVGVHPTLIRERCPEQKAKYLPLAMLLLCVSVLSSCAVGYAIYSVFLSPGVAIFAGCFWAFFIYNLDRTMLNGFHKRRKQSHWQSLKMIVPRLVLAVALAIPMAYPLEKRLFYDGIKKVSLEQAGVQNIQPDIERLKRENEQLRETWQNLKSQKDEYVASVYPQKREDIPLIEQQMQERLDEIDANKARIQSLEQGFAHEQERQLGFIEQMIYFQQLTDTYPEVKRAGWFISLLFIGIEVTVVLVKALMAYGIYEAIVEEMEESHIRKSMNDLKLAELKMKLALKQERRVLQDAYQTTYPALKNTITESILEIFNAIQTSPEFQEVRGKILKQATERVTDDISAALKRPVHQPDPIQDISRLDNYDAVYRHLQSNREQKLWEHLEQFSKNTVPNVPNTLLRQRQKKNPGKKRQADPPSFQDI